MFTTNWAHAMRWGANFQTSWDFSQHLRCQDSSCEWCF